ncbi:lipopolysaccharide biosynthesis protein wbpB [Helicobacter bizzozeronii CCUG 35545]|nr:lipopolysaccharide biosynthesis protein wbpB [Helicobacter bizzozeronii CCUG 35545]
MSFKNVSLLPPLSYLETLYMLTYARLVLTDSGGLQKEACFLGTPVLVMRENSEYPELLEGGGAILVGTHADLITRKAQELLTKGQVSFANIDHFWQGCKCPAYLTSHQGACMLFGIIGVGGFVAPRHIKAIYETGHVLDCAVDEHDSVGILDQYYLDCEFFTSLGDLHQYLQDCKAQNKFLDFMVICTPNYLHFEHIEFALSHGIHAICEKPLVLDPNELDEIKALEKKYNRRVFNILQLRTHPNIINLKNSIQASLQEDPSKIYHISLTYLVLRGKWYFNSWKGDEDKSGGLATNIGIHFF